MFSFVLTFLVSFLSISPTNGYTYTDSISYNQVVVSNSSYSSTEKVYVNNEITFYGYLNYNSINDYKIVGDYIKFKSSFYYDDSTSWDSASYIELVIPLDNIYGTIESYIARLRYTTYFDDDYFIIKADLLDNNDDYWNPIDSVAKSLTSVMINDDTNVYRFNIENMEQQILNRIKGQTLISYSESQYNEGYANGYTEGFNEGFSADSTAVTIFNGILNIALVPINFFLAIFNFEILGINISSFVSAILSVCLVIIVIRFITGKKQGD